MNSMSAITCDDFEYLQQQWHSHRLRCDSFQVDYLLFFTGPAQQGKEKWGMWNDHRLRNMYKRFSNSLSKNWLIDKGTFKDVDSPDDSWAPLPLRQNEGPCRSTLAPSPHIWQTPSPESPSPSWIASQACLLFVTSQTKSKAVALIFKSNIWKTWWGRCVQTLFCNHNARFNPDWLNFIGLSYLHTKVAIIQVFQLLCLEDHM